MFNLNYFKYLLKSKSYLLIFASLLSLLITFTNTGKNYKTAYIGLIIICFILCFGLPCLIFEYVHNKRAVDTYYSLNISRKSMLITGLIFCFISVFIIFTINSIIIYISEINNVTEIMQPVNIDPTYIIVKYGLPTRILIMSLCFLCLIIFNTCIYLFAHTAFDGIVILGAYTLLPLAIEMAISSFTSAFVYGYSYNSYNYIAYLSPSYLTGSIYNHLINGQIHLGNTNFLSLSIFAILLFLIISYIILYRNYEKFKPEKAGTISNSIPAYPLIINLYALISVFTITCDSFIKEYSIFNGSLLFYFMIFSLYMIAHFIYLRKLSLNFKTPLTYLLYIGICLLICQLALKTNGFGLSERYIRNDETVVYSYQLNYDYPNNVKESEINKWLENNLPEDYKSSISDEYFIENKDYYYLNINISNTRSNENLDQETIDFFENMREKAIKEHYQEDSGIEASSTSYLYVSNNVIKFKDGTYISNNGYSYQDIKQEISLKDLLKMSYNNKLYMYIYYENASAKVSDSFILADGKLKLFED